KVCVRTGWISRPGQMIVCAPNRLSVEVTGDTGLDAETW
ncbi:NusG domain II-containing protein, partial [candidate division WOR-3 bacterium]|nr:NusG domain II-containing protein [candidate division WOR-3 bacterium]